MQWVKAMGESELAEGDKRVVELEGRAILLLRYQGQVYAMNNKCPHLGGSLVKGKLTAEGTIVCPLHHSVFDVKTGAVKAWAPWPPIASGVLGAISHERPLTTYPTKSETGSIFVGME
jgi:nitrite reductase/ring-hydroxylating ferredoxin subunit